MPATTTVIRNRTSHSMHFHLEPDCTPFALESGKSLEVSGTYDAEPISIQFSDDAECESSDRFFPETVASP